VGPTQDTLSKVSLAVRGTLTPGTTVHDVPFHCSMSVPPPVLSFCCPTATQKEELVHETLLSWFWPIPDGALALDQFVAATVGVLVGFPATAEADPVHPTVSNTSATRGTIRNIRNPATMSSLNSLEFAPAAEYADARVVSSGLLR
jgi:hypothetical protein